MTDATLTLRRLNDSFRSSLSGGGKRLMSAGVAALPYRDQAAILGKVISLDQLDEGNDPHQQSAGPTRRRMLNVGLKRRRR